MSFYARFSASGALSSLKDLRLHWNQIGDDGLKALAEACASGALASLKELNLAMNQIGDAGLNALAEAIKPTANNASGALASLTTLELWGNAIGDDGMKALADACASGALASLKELVVDNSEHPALEAACLARGIDV